MEESKDRFPHIPERIAGLGELAYNLWWSRHPEARMLFKMLNRPAWKLSVHNPVKMLRDIDGETLADAAKDPKFLRHHDAVQARLTSGMKASLNGVPHLSILDGWWPEGFNGKNGWAFEGAEGELRDARDAEALYEILKKKVIPLYYKVDDDGVPRDWVRVMKEAIKSNSPVFSARRMTKEYAEKFYREALKSAIGKAGRPE
ncbi:MAG: DUF3417 domain-containing protein [Nitrospiraceae bacterium]|nr:DUF3417 domain-containing protein [Nitrospiraceae bacterium]